MTKKKDKDKEVRDTNPNNEIDPRTGKPYSKKNPNRAGSGYISKRKKGSNPGIGRTRKIAEWTEEQLEMVQRMAGAGLTKNQIAQVLGVSRATLHNYERWDEELSAHINLGKAKCEAAVGEALVQRALQGDVPAIRWWEMTRTGRKESVEQTSTNFVIAAPAESKDAKDWLKRYGGTGISVGELEEKVEDEIEEVSENVLPLKRT